MAQGLKALVDNSLSIHESRRPPATSSRNNTGSLSSIEFLNRMYQHQMVYLIKTIVSAMSIIQSVPVYFEAGAGAGALRNVGYRTQKKQK